MSPRIFPELIPETSDPNTQKKQPTKPAKPEADNSKFMDTLKSDFQEAMAQPDFKLEDAVSDLFSKIGSVFGEGQDVNEVLKQFDSEGNKLSGK